jgi:hypothetical protein
MMHRRVEAQMEAFWYSILADLLSILTVTQTAKDRKSRTALTRTCPNISHNWDC